MNCKNCNQDLTSFMFLKGFNYCPYCGVEINDENKEEKLESYSAYIVSNTIDSAFPENSILTINAFNTDFELVKCPAGKFLMGSPADEIGRFKNETQHEVIINKDFYIGKYPITQAQYKAIIQMNPSQFKAQNKPVCSVTWHWAKEFCYRLNEATVDIRPDGYLFDLPTEAQWEYACRANTITSLNSGKNISKFISKSLRKGINSNLYYGYTPTCPNLDELGWYEVNSFKELQPVGQKKPNNWGIYDMHGNIFEWCRDYYLESYLPGNADPDGEENKDGRVCRGGSFRQEPQFCRTAYRHHVSSGCSGEEYGFRIALICSDKFVKY